MQLADHPHSSRFSRWKPYLFLLFIAVIAYWPISLQLFSVKNDAIHYFLPVRYQVSNSIQQGWFPYWSSSFYLGYPLHGDMQSGVWNPFVQLISLVTKYNITVFHFETLLYIFLAGAGMYKLSGIISGSNAGRLVIATAYMLCGYILGSGEFINWLASAAFVPYVLCYYHRLLHEPGAGNALKCAIATWLLLVCGYPADSIIVAYVLAGMGLYFFIKNRQLIRADRGLVKKWLGYHGLFIIAAMLLLSPALLSYFELLPYYSRGTGAGQSEAMINSFDPKSSLSFVAPWSAIAGDFPASGDVTGRNIFLGIYTLVFAVAGIFSRNSPRKTILRIAAISSFLFCLGDATPFRSICYNLIPGMDLFRHPSHFRLYTIIALLLLAAGLLDRVFQKEDQAEKITRFVMIGMGALLFIGLVISILSGAGHFAGIFSAIGNREALKNFLQRITWKDMLLASCIIQLLFIAAYLFFTRKKKAISITTLLMLHILNLVISSALVLPATFVSKTPPSMINKLIRQQTALYDPANYNKTLAENSKDAFDHSNEIGLSFFYSEKPGLTRITNSPAFLTSMDIFVQTSRLFDHIYKRPAAWLSNNDRLLADTILLTDSSNHSCTYTFPSEVRVFPSEGPCDSLVGEVTITNIAPGRFRMKADCATPCQLNLSQAYHRNWRAWVRGEEEPVYPTNIAFMRIHLPAGSSEITWEYDAGGIKTAFIISLLTLAGIIVFFIVGLIVHRKSLATTR